MPIEFNCPSCSRLLKTPDSAAGKKGKCPHCQSVMHIPTSSKVHHWPPDAEQAGAATSAQATAPAAARARQQPAADQFISFHCQNCNRLLKTPPQTAGKKGKCPHCGGRMQIPVQSAAPSESSGLTPLGDSSGLTPLDDSAGLTPLDDSSGLAPLGGGVGELLDDLPALQPLGNAAKSAPDNPFSAAAATALKPGPMSSNPYASPSLSSATSTTAEFGAGSKRSGLPWDNEQSANSFFQTLRMVLLSPGEAFSSMRRTGGVGGPLGFAVIGALFGSIAFSIYYALAVGAGLMLGGLEDPEEAGIVVAEIFGNGCTSVIGSVSGATIGVFISAGIFHLTMIVVGGATRPYETTLRVVAYVHGATAFLGVIPCAAYVVWIYGLVLMVLGFSKAHNVSGGQAAAAVILPFAICLVLVGTVIGLIIAVVVEAAG